MTRDSKESFWWEVSSLSRLVHLERSFVFACRLFREWRMLTDRSSRLLPLLCWVTTAAVGRIAFTL